MLKSFNYRPCISATNRFTAAAARRQHNLTTAGYQHLPGDIIDMGGIYS